jgi:uncharacterized membrane protein
MDTVAEGVGRFFGTWFFWFPDFAQSPGFAGLLALVAAIVAYIASTRNASRDRWWKRAEYALDLTLSSDESTQLAGLEMLDSLESKDAREQAFIYAATQWFLRAQVPAEPSSSDEPDAPARPPAHPAARGWRAVRGILSRVGR